MSKKTVFRPKQSDEENKLNTNAPINIDQIDANAAISKTMIGQCKICQKNIESLDEVNIKCYAKCICGGGLHLLHLTCLRHTFFNEEITCRVDDKIKMLKKSVIYKKELQIVREQFSKQQANIENKPTTSMANINPYIEKIDEELEKFASFEGTEKCTYCQKDISVIPTIETKHFQQCKELGAFHNYCFQKMYFEENKYCLCQSPIPLTEIQATMKYENELNHAVIHTVLCQNEKNVSSSCMITVEEKTKIDDEKAKFPEEYRDERNKIKEEMKNTNEDWAVCEMSTSASVSSSSSD